jgi:Protein of unknown function DUF262
VGRLLQVTEVAKDPVEDNLGDETITFKYSITSYGADYPVDGLVRRISDGSVYVPVFQRGFVWSYAQALSFIESLLLGLPVPGIFLSREQDTHRLLVVDGQQRLRTLQFFYEGVFADSKREFALRNVQPQFEGKTYKSLESEDRRTLDDSILHATVVRQDEPSDDESSIYLLFERLNTGGTQLQPQEIRACIYVGEFNELLDKLNEDPSWRHIFGRRNKRRRDQELILRFLSLYFYGEHYRRPMKEFLNIYMGKNRHLQLNSARQIEDVFVSTVQVIDKFLGPKAFRPIRALNAAILDSVMVGVAKRLEQGPILDGDAVRRSYDDLLKNERFQYATARATAGEESVATRIGLATDAFARVR